MPKYQGKHYDPESLQTSYKAQYVKPVATKNANDLPVGGSSSLMNTYMEKKKNVPFYSET